MAKLMGKQSLRFDHPPSVQSFACCAGKKEGEGPLGNKIDMIHPDEKMGLESFEMAEAEMFMDAVKRCVDKEGLKPENIRILLGGDLLDQLTASNFAGRNLGIPFLGLFGACSTMAESLLVGSMVLEGRCADRVICAASSHFCTAERQFRFPLELGAQRPPSAQWTVTGAGAVMLSQSGTLNRPAPRITFATVGKPVDYGVKDATNMGAAMAPAAADTLYQHFMDTSTSPEDYDLIATGDLGMVGVALFHELMRDRGMALSQSRHIDCGLQIFDANQDTHAGGSGCGCSATVLCADLLPRVSQGKIDRLLFMATGALMSPTSSNLGETIPSIAHAVVIERA